MTWLPVRIQTALFFLIAAPIAMLVWIGFSMMRAEELRAKRQVAALAEGRLLELVQTIDDFMSSQHRSIMQKMDQSETFPDDLVSLERTNPYVRRTMWVSARGRMLYPPPPSILSDSEFLLYNELSLMARQRPALQRPALQRPALQRPALGTRSQPSANGAQELAVADSGWQKSYFDEGLQLVLWKVKTDGAAIGCWLERARWMSDLVAILPDVEPALSQGATVLEDANGNEVYRWGAIDVQSTTPLAETPLKEPLATWRIRYYVTQTPSDALTMLSYWPWVLGISTIAIVLLGLGAYVSLATSQQLRLASQRVSFVGQVSHELRTPLTNIRLYAEMAQRDLAQSEPSVKRIAERIEVIDSESKRLSRLISGVLDFMQGRGKERPVANRAVVPDEIIRQVLRQCSISLERNCITVSTDLDASTPIGMDSDVLEQILINLINNVEKYAASGKSLFVASRLDGETLTVDVRDTGPGVQSRYVDRIFEPFFRLDNANTAPSGTGLGLTIARNAAKRHGGGLELIPTDMGAHFRLWVLVQRVPIEQRERDA